MQLCPLQLEHQNNKTHSTSFVRAGRQQSTDSDKLTLSTLFDECISQVIIIVVVVVVVIVVVVMIANVEFNILFSSCDSVGEEYPLINATQFLMTIFINDEH